MPAPKTTTSKDKQAAGSAPTKDTKKKDVNVAAPEAPKAAPAPAAAAAATTDSKPKAAATDAVHGKPDQAAYNKEQDDVKKEIDELNKTLSALKEKIALATKSGPNDRRNELKAELDALRAQQGDGKTSRDKILTQLKALNESVSQKIKDLQASKGKSQFKSVAELDAHVKKLDAQVESGNMKLVDERRAIQEISNAKRQRRVIEGYQSQQEAIDAEKANADELRKQLDDPDFKAVSERYDAIKAELDELKKASDEAYASRNVLFDERTALQAQMDELYTKKKQSAQKYREAQDQYWAKVQEDRTRKAEKARQARQAVEDEKKQEMVERLREEAEAPAYQAQIEDCQTLIDYFSGTASTSSTGLDLNREGPASVPELDLRKVDEAIGENLVPLKKRAEEDSNYFIAAKRTKAKKNVAKANGGTAPPDPTPAIPAGSEKMSVPFAKFTALASLSIPSPMTAADVPQTIENLKMKKEWFMANQQKQTETNKAKAEKEIASLLRSINSHAANGNGAAPADGSEDSMPETPKAVAEPVEA